MIQPQKGDRINNYLLDELVGSGSFGQVWRAKHHVLDQVAAIKILTDPQYVRNFRQEGVVVHGIRHANIVRVMDIDPYGDPPYMVMEYIDGASLRQLIDGHPGGLPIDLCVRIMRGVLAALQVAHDRGLVHRDVKPANILINMPDGDLAGVESDDVKLTDFGLGKTTHVTAVSLMQSGSLKTEDGRSIAGTINYMAPEQRQGEEVDHRGDLYSCAVVLFEILTGARPAGSDMPSMVRDDVPEFLDDVFRGSYTRLERRFPSAAEMLSALDRGAAVFGGVNHGGANHGGFRRGGLQSSPPPAARVIGQSMAKCPQCDGSVNSEDNFCIHCGTQMTSVVVRCTKCKGYAGRDDRFCIFCGNALTQRVV